MEMSYQWINFIAFQKVNVLPFVKMLLGICEGEEEEEEKND